MEKMLIKDYKNLKHNFSDSQCRNEMTVVKHKQNQRNFGRNDNVYG